MASSVIGSLRVNLGLDSANFDKGTKKAGNSLADMGKKFAAISAAAAALGTAIAAAAMKGAQEIDKAAKAARRLDASVGAFRALELAAGEAGVPLSSITNDIQSMNREIANIGTSGNADRALERIGLSVSDIVGLDADEKIATIADAVKGLGLSSGEATAVLRDLGVRNREMALLVIGGGDAIRNARKDIEEYGLRLNEVDTAKIEQANDRLGRLGLISQYVSQELALKLVPTFGRLAQAMTESLREGGALRTVLDGMIGNLDRLSAYVGVIVAGFGTRYVGALVAARVATLSLAGALATLRTAIVRTGFGIAIVLAGELTLRFGRLVSATGSFGNAMATLKDVAVEVLGRIGDAIGTLPLAMDAASSAMHAHFLRGLEGMLQSFQDFTNQVVSGLNDTFSLSLPYMDIEAIRGIGTGSLSRAAASAEIAAAGLNAELSDALSGIGAPLESLSGLMRDVAADTGTATASIAAMNDSLDDTAGGGGGGNAGGAGKSVKDQVSETKQAINEMMEDSAQKAQQASDQIRGTMTDAFKNILNGANSLKDGLATIFASVADMMLTRAGDNLFGGFADFIGKSMFPGFANGTSFAPGGLAIVGERGPELVNLPRGSQVIPNHEMQSGGGAGGSATFNIDARGADQAAVARLERWAENFSQNFGSNVLKTMTASGRQGITKNIRR